MTGFLKIRISYVIEYMNEGCCDYRVFSIMAYAGIWRCHTGVKIRDEAFVQY